jgi:hypothetical protein
LTGAQGFVLFFSDLEYLDAERELERDEENGAASK